MTISKRGFLLGVILSLYVFYALVDIVHYFNLRTDGFDGVFRQASYESYSISLIKWILSVVAVVSILIFSKLKDVSIYLLLSVSILMLTIFFIKGSFVHPMRGSFGFNYFLPELASLISIGFSLFHFRSGKSLSLMKLMLVLLVTTLIYLVLINPVEALMPLA